MEGFNDPYVQGMEGQQLFDSWWRSEVSTEQVFVAFTSSGRN